MFDFNKSLMFLHKKADLPTYESVCWALNRHFRVFGLGSVLLALTVIQKAHNFKSKNGMLINGCLTH